MENQISVPCPSCQTKIALNPSELLMGKAFECPGCDVKISIANDNLTKAKDIIDKFNDLKKGLND